MTVKQTGGGTFNPAERHLWFAAGMGGSSRPVRWPQHLLVAVNDVLTDGAEYTNLVQHLDTGRQVLLDSGIFWLATQHAKAHGARMEEALTLAPTEIDGFAELFDRFTELVDRYGDRLWGWIELDQGGAVNKRATRARLESAGMIPIPVYHPLNDGWDYFDELAGGYDRICLGNTVNASRATRVRMLHTLWERHRAYPDLWVHILGLTPSEWCLGVPVDSCDSSTWLQPLRWPVVRTESAMLRRVGDLGPGFSYDLANPDAGAGRDRSSGLEMCGDAVTNLNLNWQHAARRTAAVLSQDPYPPYLSGELLPAPGQVTP